MMAAVSHLPHVVANVLVAQAARALGGERLPPTGPSFRDATRVAGANPALWPDIYLANRDALLARDRRHGRAPRRGPRRARGGRRAALAGLAGRGRGRARGAPRGRARRRHRPRTAGRRPQPPRRHRRHRPDPRPRGDQHLRHGAPRRPPTSRAARSPCGSARTPRFARRSSCRPRLPGERLTWPRTRPSASTPRPASGRADAARRQVDLAPRGDLRRDGRRARPRAQLPRGRRHDLLARRGPRPRRARRARRRRAHDPRRRPARRAGPDAPIDVGNAGTLMRLLPGWLAAPGRPRVHLDGDDSIRRRPVDRIATPLRQMGARIDARDGRLPPFTVHRRAAARHHVRAAGRERPDQVVRRARRAVRRRADHDRRARAEPRPHRADVRRGRRRRPARRRAVDDRPGRRARARRELTVPGDPSSAAFAIAAALLVPGLARRRPRREHELDAHRLRPHRPAHGRPDRGALEDARGGDPARRPDRRPRGRGRPAPGHDGRGRARCPSPSTSFRSSRCSAASPRARRSSAARRAARQGDRPDRDRGRGLRGLGAEIEATDDGFVVQGTGGLRGGTIASHGDHRLAMLGAVAGLASREGVEVAGMDAAAVSYPSFEADIRSLVK